jgi:16S rRNA (adenine1518-N6/adenine1519-N6)-dimethyltransferase
MRLSRSLGQVFLKNKSCIKRIVDSLELDKEEVLEIGSGAGQISEQILEKAKFLYCVELDSRFVALLKNKFKDKLNVEVINSDILKFPLQDLNKKLIVFGNVPYQISNNLIKYLIDNKNYIKRAYLTFQKEFAQKLTARVSTQAYGFLSCYIQYHADVKKIFDIPKEYFLPMPNVDSAFVRLEFYPQPVFKVKDENFLFKIIRKAFSQRRKKIINSLPLAKDRQVFFSSLGISPDKRAEDLSLEEYIAIANKLYQE